MAQNVRLGRLELSFRQAVDPPADNRGRIRSQVEIDDLLVTIVGANTGDVCRVPTELPEHYVCQSVALMRPVDSSVSPYLEVYLASQYGGQRQFERYIYGQGRPHLSFDQIRMTPVMLPPIEEQLMILNRLETDLPAVNHTEETVCSQLKRCQRLRQSILKWAFEGKLVDQNPKDEPASVLLDRIQAERAALEATSTKSNGRKPGRRRKAK